VRRMSLLVSILALVCCAVCLSGTTATAGDKDKMPITTKSEKALKYYLQGRDLAERLRGQESREFFQKAVDTDPEFAMAHLALSQTAATNKAFFEQFDKARALVNRVSDAERYQILGFEAGAINGDPISQRDYFTKLVNLYPNDERAHDILGGHHFGQQDYSRAVTEYEKATKINPSLSQSYNQMGYAYRLLERYDDAETAFKTYIKLIPDDPNPHDSYAELLMKMGRFDESIENYRNALKINPSFVFSHLGIASNLCFKSKHTAARGQLKTMYENCKDDGQRRTALFATAVTYVDEGQTDMALAECQKQYGLAEAINDISAMAGDHNLMGTILLNAGQLDEAEKHFDKSLSMIEKSTLSQAVKDQAWLTHLFNTSRVQTAKGEIELARTTADDYRKRVEMVDNRNQIRLAHQLLGTIALKTDEFETARRELLQANQLNPQNIYRLAQAYEGLKQTEKAKGLYRKAANYNTTASMNLAFVRTQAGDKIAMM
jgi:tetratricopeptide (TPR) repeat protein